TGHSATSSIFRCGLVSAHGARLVSFGVDLEFPTIDRDRGEIQRQIAAVCLRPKVRARALGDQNMTFAVHHSSANCCGITLSSIGGLGSNLLVGSYVDFCARRQRPGFLSQE